MMPSVVKANPTVSKQGSAAAGTIRKPTTLEVPRKRSQVLVNKESSHGVKSHEFSGVSSSKSSLASGRSLRLADGSVKQTVDLVPHGAAVVATTDTGRAVTARNPAVRTSLVKSSSSESAKSSSTGDAQKSSALKTINASGAVARVGNAAKTTVYRKSVVETSRREEISSSCADKRKSGAVAASLSGSVKHEVSLNRCSRVPTASRTKTSGTVLSLAATKPRTKRENGSSSVTSRISVKRDKVSSAPVAVKPAEKKRVKQTDDDKSLSSRSSSSSCVSKLAELISAATPVDGSEVISDQVIVSSSVPESLPAVNVNSSLCNVCEVKERSQDANEVSDHRSHVTFESPHCKSVQNGMHPCEYVLKSTDVTASVTCAADNGSDLEETSICDVSLNSCFSDCSTSLFHSACSSIIGSVNDMKPPSLDGSVESDHLAKLSGSNSVSVESLHSSAVYCTPSETNNFCDLADCTLLNTDDSRYVYLFLLPKHLML